MREFVAQCVKEITIRNECEIEEMQIAEEHVHVFLGFPPKYAISTVLKRLKGTSARAIFRRYAEVRRELWGNGHFFRTVDDNVTNDMIKRYTKYHKDHETVPQ